MSFEPAMRNNNGFALRIKTKLLLSYSATILATLATCFIGFSSYSTLGQSITQITDQSLPDFSSAMTLTEHARILEVTLPQLAATKNNTEHHVLTKKINQQIDSITLAANSIEDSSQLLNTANQLKNETQIIDKAVREKINLGLTQLGTIQRVDAVQAQFNKNIEEALNTTRAEREQIFKNSHPSSRDTLDKLVSESLVKLTAILNLKSDINKLLKVMTNAAQTTKPNMLGTQQELADELKQNITNYSNAIGTDILKPPLALVINDLINNQTGYTRFFEIRASELSGTSEPVGSQVLLDKVSQQINAAMEILSGVIDTVYWELVMSAESSERPIAEELPQPFTAAFGDEQLLREYRENSNKLVSILTEVTRLENEDLLAGLELEFQRTEALLHKSIESTVSSKGPASVKTILQTIEISKAKQIVFSLKNSEFNALSDIEKSLRKSQAELSNFFELVDKLVVASNKLLRSARADSQSTIQRSQELLALIAIASLICTILFMWLLISRNLFKRINYASRALQRISHGKIPSRLEVSGHDEISKLLKRVNEIREKEIEHNNFQKQVTHDAAEKQKQIDQQRQLETEGSRSSEKTQRLKLEKADHEIVKAKNFEKETNALTQVVQAASNGNLIQKITIQGDHPIGQLAYGLDTLIKTFTTIMNQITTTTKIVASGTLEIANSNNLLSERTLQQAVCLEDTTTTMLSITKSAKQNTCSAENASELTNQAQCQIQEVSQIVTQTVEAMNEINSSSTKVTAIVGVIDEIASQTNLLALNAAVEAARAGEQGRGFAIVATEVRSLAGRSGDAAQEIKTLINDSVEKINHGVDLVGKSEQRLEELLNIIKLATDTVAAISVNADNQTKSIETINDAVILLDETTQQNISTAEQTTGISNRMTDEIEDLIEQINFFKFKKVQNETSNTLSDAA